MAPLVVPPQRGVPLEQPEEESFCGGGLGAGEEGAASGQEAGDGEAGGEGARGQSAPDSSGSAAGRSILRRFRWLWRARAGRIRHGAEGKGGGEIGRAHV